MIWVEFCFSICLIDRKYLALKLVEKACTDMSQRTRISVEGKGQGLRIRTGLRRQRIQTGL